MLVSICVIAYNEEKTLENLLNDIKKQDYPHEKMEIVLIDSMSTDSTRLIMENFKKQTKDFESIQILENKKKRLAPGWNIALNNYRGDVIIRVDAHATIPVDFVHKNVMLLEQGENVCGGQRPNIIDENTPWKETLLLAEQSMFGSSIAFYRRGKKNTYVKSIFHGAYRREVFDEIGGFNEELGRTEDNEIHYRIRKAGYKICYSPEIISYQHTRSSLKGMLKQKFGNGYWIALTMKACPRCISVYHLIPFLFIISIAITTALAICGISLPAIILWGLYWLLSIIMALLAVVNKKKSVQQILLPGLFFLLHVSYGIGSVIGFIKLPFWKYKA